MTEAEHLDRLTALRSWLQTEEIFKKQEAGGCACTSATTDTPTVCWPPGKHMDKFKRSGATVMDIHLRVNNGFVKQGRGTL